MSQDSISAEVRAIRKRDLETVTNIDRALEQTRRALRSMPNSVYSKFDGDDAKRLDEIARQLAILTTVSLEIPADA